MQKLPYYFAFMKTGKILLFLFILYSTVSKAQMNHVGFPDVWAYYPSLDYVQIAKKSDNEEVTYSGMGLTIEGVPLCYHSFSRISDFLFMKT